MQLVNIYNDNESAIIIDEGSTNLTEIQQFKTLGASPFNTTDSASGLELANANLFFIEINIYTEDETLLIFEETGIMEIKNSSSSEIPSL